MPTLTLRDDRDRTLLFNSVPKRVVSLVPSDTLSVCDLGCAGALVGRTDYCTTPTSIESVQAVGGTKNPRVDDIIALSPPLIIEPAQIDDIAASLRQVLTTLD
jgi:ABC-type Fe3+-hydroxamate transport system substrate-binding protein